MKKDGKAKGSESEPAKCEREEKNIRKRAVCVERVKCVQAEVGVRERFAARWCK